MSEELLAALICIAGGLAGGLVGVGGGVLFVPALTIFLGLTQVEGESTSLLMIVIVALVGASARAPTATSTCATPLVDRRALAARRADRRRVANNVSERALQLSFAALALFIAYRLLARALATPAQIGAFVWRRSDPSVVSKRGFPYLGRRYPAAALAGPGLLLPRLERRRQRRLDGAGRRRRVASTPS